MKALNALIVSAAALTLGACDVNIGDGVHGYDASSGESHMTVTLPDGDRDSFSCPSGTDAFVVDKSKDGKGMIYGCRTTDAPMPKLEG
ncbi:hypothetical protein [Kordiimonas marina]|uniref:hypothetical protein n=1 Tax=Kordiimonas marina TaxID=2872312 RepID=UPI001FF11E79|nr:hypothetical protein [Kordiimonas marina]MCJ9428517.1 hypothetical protein [Kordiimonas marina]